MNQATTPSRGFRTMINALFANTHGIRALRSSMIWTFALQAISKGSVLVSTILYARILTTTELGVFAAMQATVILAVSLWDTGFSSMLSREIAASEIRSDSILRTAVRQRLIFLPLFALVLGTGWFVIEGQSHEVAVAFALVALSGLVLGISTIFDGIIRAWLDFRTASLAQIYGRLASIFLLTLLTVMHPNSPVVAAAAVVALTELMVLGTLVFGLWRSGSIGAMVSGVSLPMAEITRRSWPFAANGFFTIVYNRADILLVVALAGSVQAGLYAPASRVQDALMMVPSVAAAGLIQIIARTSTQADSIESNSVFRLSVFISLGVTIPLVAIAVVCLPWFIPAFLGDEYTGAITPSRILALSVPMAALEAPLLSLLIAKGFARLSTLTYATALLASLVGHLILTPKLGATGAATASLLREPLALATCFFCVYRAGLGDSVGLWRRTAE